MTAILTGLNDLSTALLAIVTSLVSTVVAAPLLLIPVLIGFISSGIMIFKSLRHG